MENKPYHHLPDGTFRNPEGSPVRDSSFNWSYKIFNKEKKKLDMNVPTDHVINKKQVLENQFRKGSESQEMLLYTCSIKYNLPDLISFISMRP